MFAVVYAILYLLSLLPMRVLYLLSDLANGLLFGIIGYRKQVIRSNIQHAFPHTTPAEQLAIEKAFRTHFCDQWIETVKLLSVNEAWLAKRVQANWALVAGYEKVFFFLGHQFNFEWGNRSINNHIEQSFVGIYKPISSKVFHKLMYRLRSATGNVLFATTEVKALMGFLKNHRPYAVGLIADQNPSQPAAAQWVAFRHRLAPFFQGPAKYAVHEEAAIVFADLKRVRRGYYQFEFSLYTSNAKGMNVEKITEDYVHFLNEALARQPANYLWSHRRWKHKPPVEKR